MVLANAYQWHIWNKGYTGYVVPVRAFGATALAVTTQPVGFSSGAALNTQPVVRIVDASGNTMTGSTASVTVTASGGTLGGTTTVAAVNGVATFTNLTHTTPGTYTLTFASTALTSVTSASFTTTTDLCSTGGYCYVGNTGPGGGKVFYVGLSNFTSTGSACGTACKYLEAAPTGWITAATPAGQTNCSIQGTSSADPGCEWSGNTGTSVGTTAQGVGIGSGYANTSAMIAQASGGSTAGRAATVSRAFQGGGKTDWYLPARAELNELCKFARGQTTGNTATTCSGAGTLGTGFAYDLYWTSTEFISSQGWNHHVGNGNVGSNLKTLASSVRPVRAFSASSAIAVATQPVGSTSGTALSTQPVVRIVDAAGTTVTHSSASVTATASGGTLGGTTTVTAVNGVATFTNLTHTTAGTYTLTFASTSPATLTSITSSSFTTATNTCISGGACVIGMVGPGGGVVFITPSTSGNTTGMYFEAARATWNGGTNDPQGLTWSTNTTSLIAGADGTAIGTGNQNTLDMYAAEPSSTTAAGKALNLNVGGVDDWFLPSYDEARQIATQCTVIGDLSCSSVGYWTSTEMSSSQAWSQKMNGAVQYPSKAATNQYTRPVRSFRVASELAVTTEPVGSTSGSALATQPVVRVVDALGNTVTISTASVTVTASGGTLGGTTTVTAVNGIATFTNLTHATAGTYTLTFASTALTSVTSANFTTGVETCASGGTCYLGNTGPGGGKVFYVAVSAFTSTGSACATACRYLEAAPISWSTAVQAAPNAQTSCSTAGGTTGSATADPQCVWSGNTSTAVGTASSAIGGGYANTTAIIGQANGGNTAGKAATVARGYQGGSQTDWYLPSYGELTQMRTNNSYLGGYTNGTYWTSTEVMVNGAYLQYIYIRQGWLG